MAVFELELIFNEGRTGWSEVYYYESSSATPERLYSTLALGQSSLFQVRASVLAGSTEGGVISDSLEAARPYLEGFRIKGPLDPTAPPGTLIPEYGGSTGTIAQNINKPNPGPMAGDRTLNLRIQTTGSNARRILMLRGLPLAWVVMNPSTRKASGVKTAGGQKAIDKLIELFVDPKNGQSNFRMKRSVRSAAGATDVVSVTCNATNGRIELQIPGNTFAINDRIALRGFRKSGLRGFTGVTRVYNKVGDTVTLYRKCCDPCIIPGTTYYTPDASAWKVTTQYVAWNLCEITGWGQKKLGRAFFPSVGRRSNKQRCC